MGFNTKTVKLWLIVDDLGYPHFRKPPDVIRTSLNPGPISFQLPPREGPPSYKVGSAQLVIQLALLYIHENQAWYNLLIIDIPQLRGLKTYLNR